MAEKVLVETGFLLALNPQDKHHKWALQILEQARKGNIQLFLSEIAILELLLILRSKGVSEEDISVLLESLDIALRSYTKINYAHITFETAILASQLRQKYPNLTFFDSHHAAIAIINNLKYHDLDPLVREIVLVESR